MSSTRQQPAVADRSREPSADLPNDMRADDRVHAVGADNQIGCGIRSVRELQLDAGTTLVDAHAAAGEVQPVAAQPLRECLKERDAMHAVVGRAERRLVRPVAPDRVIGDDLAGIPATNDQRRWNDRDGLDLIADPEAPQLARAVSRQRDRGADLAQLPRLLVDLEADPALAQGEREDQPTDPAADDRDLQLGHGYAIAGVRAGASAKS